MNTSLANLGTTTSLNKNKQVGSFDIPNLIREYLDFYGFVKTSQQFLNECQTKSIRLSSRGSSTELSQKKDNPVLDPMTNELWRLFCGTDIDIDSFFQELQDFVERCGGSLESSVKFKELEFKLYLDYAVRPGAENEAMKRLRNYMEASSSVISKSTEFLQYFALPFVPNPKSHPSFRHLFEVSWRLKLEAEFKQILKQMASGPQIPELLRLLSQSGAISSMPSGSTAANGDYEALLEITSSFVDTITSLMAGDEINMDEFQSCCDRLAELNKRHLSSSQNHRSTNSFLTQDTIVLNKIPKLNASLLKRYFETVRNTHDIALFVYSLFMRLEKSESVKQQEEIQELCNNDVFGLLDNRQGFWSLLQEGGSRELLEQGLKLINSMTFHAIGRSYLIRSEAFIPFLIRVIEREEEDSIIRQAALGAIQKLSTLRKAQSALISAGYCDEFIRIMNTEGESLADNSIEFLTSTMMNLCLRSGMKVQLATRSTEIIKILSNLIEKNNYQIRVYVHGCLYNMFAWRDVKERANSLGLVDLLSHAEMNCESSLRPQIRLIIERLDSGDHEDDDEEIDDTISEDGSDYEEDAQDGEFEDDFSSEQNHEFVVQNGDIFGAELLRRFMDTDGAEKRQSRPSSRSKYRPSTPFDTVKSRVSSRDKSNNTPPPPPSKKAIAKIGSQNLDLNEYTEGFSTRPRVLRTPMPPHFPS